MAAMFANDFWFSFRQCLIKFFSTCSVLSFSIEPFSAFPASLILKRSWADHLFPFAPNFPVRQASCSHIFRAFKARSIPTRVQYANYETCLLDRYGWSHLP